MALPEGLTREHIEHAIAQLEAGVKHPFGPSTHYDLVVNGKAYPPKAVVGLAAALATSRKFGPGDFSGGEGSGQANAVLESLGFAVQPKGATRSSAPSEGEPVAFSTLDCELFTRHQSGAPWGSVDAADQDRFKDLRLRLKTLAQHLAPIGSQLTVPLASVASQTAPNGRVPREMWSCVFPSSVKNKSFALQFAVIINGTGVEICCCLGAGTSQETDAETLRQLQQAWTALRGALVSLPEGVQRALEARMGDRWQLRRSWLEEPDQNDFASIRDWLAYASSDQGTGASISRNLNPAELQDEGERFGEHVAADLEAFAGLFRHAYATVDTGRPGSAPSAAPDSTLLHPRIRQELTELRATLLSRGELPSLDALQRYYTTFGERFGPEVLRAVEGEALLSLMHETTKDGLVYWLEFKDDDEFPAKFGSIAGGSALKFGLYRRRETGAWMTGTPTAQREISTADAVVIARTHRDQLIAAHDVLARFPSDSNETGYVTLQAQLTRVAPDVQDSAWGHKYLSLLHPDKLDDYHAIAYQRFHLIKALIRPSAAEGRYVNASRYLAVSRLLQWPVNHLTTVLNRRDGSPHRYWRVGTRGGNDGHSYWEAMRDQSMVSVGWPELGDLSAPLAAGDFKESVRKLIATHFPGSPQVVGRSAQQLVHFCRSIQSRDYVLACDGATVLGVGQVTGPYAFDPSDGFPHRRSVDWLTLGEWRLPTTEGLRTTVHEFKRNTDNLVAIEARVMEVSTTPAEPPRPRPSRPSGGAALAPTQWTAGGMVGRIQDVLNRKGQVILYGPPGTGKTHWAELAATTLAALWNCGAPFEQLSDQDRARVFGANPDTFVQFCCFHPGYGYEDFIEGYRPGLQDGALHFERQDGLFKRLCETAAGRPNARYYLIVDEINRGDIPRIFGELLTLLEKPKRGTGVSLPLSGHSLTVPPNVFVIGTMNTADRSIALLDAALRRRFGFIELMPDVTVLGDTVIEGIALGPWLAAVNGLIAAQVGRDGRNLQIGHSYFLVGGHPIQELSQLSCVLREDVLPLLEEYCYDEWESLERILGSGFVDIAGRRFKAELFEPQRQEALVQAILAATPDIGASAIAVAADTAAHATQDAGDDEDAEEEDVPG